MAENARNEQDEDTNALSGDDWTVRVDARHSLRADARLSLQAVSFVAAPTAASANLASPVSLFTQQAETETPSTSPDSLLRDGQTAGIVSHRSASQDLAAYFAHPDFDASQLQLRFSTEGGEGDLTPHVIGLEDVPKPAAGDVVYLVFADEAGRHVQVVATAEPSEPEADAEPVTETVGEGQTPELDVTAKDISTTVTLADAPVVSLEALLPDALALPENEVAAPLEEAPPEDQPQHYVFEGSSFGTQEIVDFRPAERIYLNDVQAEDVTAQFVRDSRGVRFEVTLDGVSGNEARIYGYVPLGEDVTIFGRDGRPVGFDEAVYVYDEGDGTLVGGHEENVLVGSDADNFMRGRRGNDVLHGGGGDDTINGGRGHDTINGGVGNDTLAGGNGRDSFLFAGRDFGADLIVDYQAHDKIHLLDVAADDVFARFIEEDGESFLLVSIFTQPEASANIRVSAHPGDSVQLYAQDGSPVEIFTAPPSATSTDDDFMILGSYGADNPDNSIYAGQGDDVVVDLGGRNILYGQEGDDSLFGGSDRDVIDGGAGDDDIYGFAGGDVFIFTGDRFGHDTVWDYQTGDKVILSDLDIGQARARFEVANGVLNFKVLVGDETTLTASVTLYRPQIDEPIQAYLTGGAILIPEDALHHMSDFSDTLTGTDGADVFHLAPEGRTHTIEGFDPLLDKLSLDVDATTLSAIENAAPDAELATLLQGADVAVTTQNGDTVISVADEVRLILEDSDDELDITQFDIY